MNFLSSTASTLNGFVYGLGLGSIASLGGREFAKTLLSDNQGNIDLCGEVSGCAIVTHALDESDFATGAKLGIFTSSTLCTLITHYGTKMRLKLQVEANRTTPFLLGLGIGTLTYCTVGSIPALFVSSTVTRLASNILNPVPRT